MLGGVESTHAKDSQQDGGEGPSRNRGNSEPPRLLIAGTGVAVALCLAVTLVHVLLVFLYVAPSNAISRAYSQQINAWVQPLFSQNWRLFAPDPQSVNRQVSARVGKTAPNGTTHVSDWIDLSSMDDSAVKHNVFPSHTSQNMLRRAWNSYAETHGTDDRPHSERAALIQEYLRNIATDRVTAQRGGTFDSIQLRVTTVHIDPPRPADGSRQAAAAPAPTATRYLPWWKVDSREAH
ncbi:MULTISPECIES: DUF5819 family protein [Streptomyces]|uniref:DUF5819 family protein n=1 Tax=Streptomyces TaxID=1883 RepID=UPI0019CD2CA9|nr:DUF5819 family protein [Streptomyces lateritius]GGU03396.1 hypothetical protein GCM10010272_55650 [Streptomyces lateritius]